MTSDGRSTGIVGYNVQAAGDTKHHLMVAYEVTNNGSDREQLASMAQQAREAMGRTKLQAMQIAPTSAGRRSRRAGWPT